MIKVELIVTDEMGHTIIEYSSSYDASGMVNHEEVCWDILYHCMRCLNVVKANIFRFARRSDRVKRILNMEMKRNESRI